MVHPTVRLAAATAIVVALLINDNLANAIAAVTITTFLSAGSNSLKRLISFTLLFMLPLWIGLIAISTRGDWTQAALMQAAASTSCRVLLLTVVGGLLQWVFLPLVEAKAVLQAGFAMGLPSSATILVAATMNVFTDLSRFSARSVEALKARGMATPPILWRVTRLPSLGVTVVSWALRSAILREETWAHRQVSIKALSTQTPVHWSVWKSLLVSGSSTAYVAYCMRFVGP